MWQGCTLQPSLPSLSTSVPSCHQRPLRHHLHPRYCHHCCCCHRYCCHHASSLLVVSHPWGSTAGSFRFSWMAQRCKWACYGSSMHWSMCWWALWWISSGSVVDRWAMVVVGGMDWSRMAWHGNSQPHVKCHMIRSLYNLQENKIIVGLFGLVVLCAFVLSAVLLFRLHACAFNSCCCPFF